MIDTNSNFTAAAEGGQSPQVITSDWQGTLSHSRNGYHVELFTFLRDAHLAGHRVIIASASSKLDLEANLDDAVELIEFRGIDLSALKKVELMTKRDLAKLTADGLTVDISFDDYPVLGQVFQTEAGMKPYADPRIEVTVGDKFTISPWSFHQLREMCELTNTPHIAAQGIDPAP